MRKHLWVVPVLCAVWLFFAFRGMFTAMPTRPQIDFEVYRYGVQAWWDGRDMYGTLPPVANGARLPFVYPPFAVLLLSPLAILPWDAAVVTLYVVSTLCLAVTIYLVSRVVWPPLGRWGGVLVTSVALPLTVFLEPVSQTYQFGQVSLIVMGLVAVDCLAGRTLWPRGVGIGLAAALKLTPAAFILYFLVRRDYRSAAWAGGTFAGAALIGFVADFPASVRYWFLGGLSGGGVSGTAFKTNQTIEASLVRMGLSGVAEKGLWLLVVAVLVVLVVRAMRWTGPVLALLANAGIALLVSPTSWSHYYVWVVPTLVLMLAQVARHAYARSWQAVPWAAWAILTAVLFKLAPFHGLPDTDFPVVHMHWTWPQQLSAATYPLIGLALLLAFALPRQRGPRWDPALPVTPEPVAVAR
ncbi:glycosyltransferase family 87 protein [Amycolatopsis cynarae]|uniref:Glycosyltransferase family 87 protein n=1 Tax=Amycolatopsis cynarae TaxID=2995223 RepID=A0ABY7B685_9PSEU|nr:glycosyltransferase family 87 protein [Amycolatopsis sp. HUAS 11-8]WAL67671.1 glycosyltransferase family 87 protein [Amycolatopsis sp. HUAS 11-8]